MCICTHAYDYSCQICYVLFLPPKLGAPPYFSDYDLKPFLNSPICIWRIVSIYYVNRRCNLIYFHINIKCLFSISKRSFSMRSLQFVMLKFFFGKIHYRKNILCWAPCKGRYVLGIVFVQCKTLWSALGIHLAWCLLNVFIGFWKES